MIKAYAAFEPKGELKPFEYDPGELKPLTVIISATRSSLCYLLPVMCGVMAANVNGER
jgi:uncharacterized zinc-type alcohol dehydrogenase-like protein